MKTKIDTDSIQNQEIKSKFVAREVKTCFSYEMVAILEASSYVDTRELKNDLPSYEDIENLYEYKCPECGDGHPSIGDFGQETDNKNEFHCPSCDAHFETEPENEPQEIFEWWIVSEFLYEKLKEKGEPVLEWGNNHYWGRTTTGQAIMMDSVIGNICKDMEILSGQKYSWETK